MKCQATLVEVEDCGPDTQRLGQVCCMEIISTVHNATIYNRTCVNRTGGKCRIETIDSHAENKLVTTERLIQSRNVKKILLEHIMGKTEGWTTEANGRYLKATDQMKKKAIENKIRAGKHTDNVGTRRKNQLFETQSDSTEMNQKKGNVQSKKGIENKRLQAKKRKRRITKRRRLQKQLDKIANELF